MIIFDARFPLALAANSISLGEGYRKLRPPVVAGAARSALNRVFRLMTAFVRWYWMALSPCEAVTAPDQAAYSERSIGNLREYVTPFGPMVKVADPLSDKGTTRSRMIRSKRLSCIRLSFS